MREKRASKERKKNFFLLKKRGFSFLISFSLSLPSLSLFPSLFSSLSLTLFPFPLSLSLFLIIFKNRDKIRQERDGQEDVSGPLNDIKQNYQILSEKAAKVLLFSFSFFFFFFFSFLFLSSILSSQKSFNFFY